MISRQHVLIGVHLVACVGIHYADCQSHEGSRVQVFLHHAGV
jgi:hypothetical protein